MPAACLPRIQISPKGEISRSDDWQADYGFVDSSKRRMMDDRLSTF